MNNPTEPTTQEVQQEPTQEPTQEATQAPVPARKYVPKPLVHRPFANIHDVMREHGLRPPRIISTPPPQPPPERKNLVMTDHYVHTVVEPTETTKDSLPDVPSSVPTEPKKRFFTKELTKHVITATLTVGVVTAVYYGVRLLLQKGDTR